MMSRKKRKVADLSIQRQIFLLISLKRWQPLHYLCSTNISHLVMSVFNLSERYAWDHFNNPRQKFFLQVVARKMCQQNSFFLCTFRCRDPIWCVNTRFAKRVVLILRFYLTVFFSTCISLILSVDLTMSSFNLHLWATELATAGDEVVAESPGAANDQDRMIGMTFY